MHPRSVSGFALRWSLCLGLVLGGIASTGQALAQDYVTFISFTNTWRYNQAGQNLGTNWVAPDYDDAADPWQSGPALLGLDSPLGNNYPAALIVPNVIPTPLSLLSNDNNHFGWDIGGGLMIFFGGHIGIRGDIRFFHTFHDIEALDKLEEFGITFLGGTKLDFGRAAAAVVFKF